MLTCKDFILDLLIDYLDKTLSPDAAQDLDRHLRACPSCVAYLNTYNKTRELIGRAVQTEMPEEMKTRLRKFLLDTLTRGTS